MGLEAGGFSKGMEFADFVAAIIAIPDEAIDRRLRSQSAQLARYRLHFLRRLETIEEDDANLFQRLGCPPPKSVVATAREVNGPAEGVRGSGFTPEKRP